MEIKFLKKTLHGCMMRNNMNNFDKLENERENVNKYALF